MRRKGPKVLRETGHEPGTEQATRAAVTRLVSTLGHAGPRVTFPTSRFPSQHLLCVCIKRMHLGASRFCSRRSRAHLLTPCASALHALLSSC